MSLIAIDDVALFDREVAARPAGAVALFTASWCRPGERLERSLADLPTAVLRVDVDRTPLLPRRFGVAGLPSLLLLRDGFVAALRCGELSDEDLRVWLEDTLGSA